MQQRLALPRPAGDVARLAMPLHLADVTADGFPALDLARVLSRNAPSHVVAAIPLKPAARIVRVDPSLLAPDRQRLAGVDPEKVQRTIPMLGGELGAREPARWKLLDAVGHVLAAEHTKLQHLRRRQLGTKLRIEAAANRCSERVAVALLHLVVDGDGLALLCLQRTLPFSTSGLTTLMG